MAEFEIDFSEDFLSELLDTDFGEIAEEALNEAAPVLEKSMQASCAKVIEHEGDSELVHSIKAGKPKRTKTDAYIVNVSPKGYSSVKVYLKKIKEQSFLVLRTRFVAILNLNSEIQILLLVLQFRCEH